MVIVVVVVVMVLVMGEVGWDVVGCEGTGEWRALGHLRAPGGGGVKGRKPVVGRSCRLAFRQTPGSGEGSRQAPERAKRSLDISLQMSGGRTSLGSIETGRFRAMAGPPSLSLHLPSSSAGQKARRSSATASRDSIA